MNNGNLIQETNAKIAQQNINLIFLKVMEFGAENDIVDHVLEAPVVKKSLRKPR